MVCVLLSHRNSQKECAPIIYRGLRRICPQVTSTSRDVTSRLCPCTRPRPRPRTRSHCEAKYLNNEVAMAMHYKYNCNDNINYYSRGEIRDLPLSASAAASPKFPIPERHYLQINVIRTCISIFSLSLLLGPPLRIYASKSQHPIFPKMLSGLLNSIWKSSAFSISNHPASSGSPSLSLCTIRSQRRRYRNHALSGSS